MRLQTCLRQKFSHIAALALALNFYGTAPAWAQNPGGVLKVFFFDSPASMSIHEEATIAGQGPMMGVFNNLIMYDQNIPQAGLNSIVADLASSWSWSAEGTALTFTLRQGVTWHDGKPFTARDVKCTWDLLLGRGNEKLRINPRKTWYGNLDEVVVDGDHQVTFRLKRKQPAFVTMKPSPPAPRAAAPRACSFTRKKARTSASPS